MSVKRAYAAVENLIAGHVAASFRQRTQRKTESTAAHIRSRITDRFQHDKLGSEQDNTPSATLALRSRLVKTFAPAQAPASSQDRTERLAHLQATLQELRNRGISAPIQSRGEQIHAELLLERQQLVLKNEFTEGFGRIETWLVSLAALALILLGAIDLLWALPILAVGIGRSMYLDRQCKKRLIKIAEIDALVGTTARILTCEAT